MNVQAAVQAGPVLGILAVYLTDIQILAVDPKIFQQTSCEIKSLSVRHDGKRAAVGQVIINRRMEVRQAMKQGAAVRYRKQFRAERPQDNRGIIGCSENKMDS